MQKQLMTVTVQQSAAVGFARTDALIVKISGEIGLTAMLGEGGDHSGVVGDTILDTELRKAVPVAPALVVIDLTTATYLSSLGISALLRFKAALAHAGSDLRLAVHGPLVTLMRFGRLDQLFSTYPDVAAALK